MRRSFVAVAAAASLVALAGTANGQSADTTKKMPKEKMEAMDHSKMAGMNHRTMMEMETGMKSPWKELDAYHMLMMATWHPAKDQNDLAPTRAKASAMVTAANTLAASTAPKGCDAPKLQAVAAALSGETQKVADLVTAKADDATLKSAMQALHEKFDVLEMGCTTPKKPTK